jgi:hypothetical protein
MARHRHPKGRSQLGAAPGALLAAASDYRFELAEAQGTSPGRRSLPWSRAGEKLFAVVHCTAGDLLIIPSSRALAAVVGRPNWPVRSFGPVAFLTMAAGLVYTGCSEWLNISIRQSWAYSDWMPVIPKLDLAVSPLLQWLVVPSLALAAARLPARAHKIDDGRAL